MLKRFKQAIVTTLAAAALLFPLAVPVMVYAADPGVNVQGSLCGGTDLSIVQRLVTVKQQVLQQKQLLTASFTLSSTSFQLLLVSLRSS